MSSVIEDRLQVSRMEPKGPQPDGMQTWEEIPASALESGQPVQRGHLYFEDKAIGLSVGVWDCTPMTTKLEPYSVDEFMYVLEGSVTMVDAKGHAETISAGEAFVLPKGFECQWKQSDYIRKFFVIYDRPADTPAADPASLKVIRPSPYGAPGGMEKMDLSGMTFDGPTPTQHSTDYFTDPTGQMTVGTWDATPFSRPVSPFNRHELMHFLEGSVTLTDGEGREHTYHAGDTIFVPKGAMIGWRSDEYVRKYYCIFKPNA